MDISFVLRKFRKSISGFTILALLTTFVSFVGVAQAGTFADVDGHWGEAYVEALYDAGVVSGNDDGTFNPDGTLLRAELAKMLVLAYTEGLDEDAAAVYSDVSSDDWFYAYANDAYQKGIMTGEADGSFNGGGMVNRATLIQAIYNAAGLTATGEDLPFSDVMSSDWFYTATDAAYWWSVVDGKTETTFAPADYATRAEASKVIYNGWYPVERAGNTVDPVEECEDGYELDEYGDCVEVTEPSSEGTLLMSVASDTPASDTLPSGATSVEVFALDLTAEDDDVMLDSITFNQYAVASLPTDHSVYFYAEVDGVETRLSSGQSVNSTSFDVTFNNVDLEVEEGETVRAALRMDVGTVTSNQSVAFQLESADMVDANGADVSGDFALMGEDFDLSTVSAGTITIEKNGSIDNAQVGEDGAEIAKFKMTASTEGANIEEIGLYGSGSINMSDMANFELWVSGEDEAIATADSVDSLDVIRFVLDDAYSLEKGDSRAFTVTADFNTGRTADTVEIYVDEDTDILAVGDLYGFGMAVSRDGYNGNDDSCASSSSVDCSFMTLEGGDITITSNGPASMDLAINGSDITLMNFDVASVTDATFKNFPISLTAGETVAASGLLNSTTANITDIKIVDTETGEEIFTAVDSNVFVTSDGGSTAIGEHTTSDDDAGDTDDDQAFHLYTDDWMPEAGSEYSLALMVDIENNSSLADDTLTATLELGSSNLEIRDVNNKTVTNSDVLVPASAITSKTHTMRSPSLALSLASTPVSDTYVKGAQDVKFTGVVLACGDASDCRITDMTLQGYLDDDGSADNFGDASSDTLDNDTADLNSYVGSIWLEDAEGNVVDGPESVNGTTYSATFSSIDWTLEAGATEVLYVMGDISSDAYKDDDVENIAFGIDSTADITVEDEDGNTFTPTGTINTAPASGTYVTVSDGGSLTVSVQTSETADEDIIVAGSTDQLASVYKFETTDEAFVINDLAVNALQLDGTSVSIADTFLGSQDNNIVGVTLEYENSEGEMVTKDGFISQGTAEFTGLDFYVPADDDAELAVYVDTNTIQAGATSGEYVELNLAFSNFDAIAQGSGETYSIAKIDSGVSASSDLDFGTISWTSTGTTSTTTTINNAGVAQTLTLGAAKDLPVGTLLMIDEDADSEYDAGADPIFVVTSAVDNSTSVTTLVADNGATVTSGKVVFYSMPGAGYLTATNSLHVYETKPTLALADSSPSGDETIDTDAQPFVFTVTADSGEEVQLRGAEFNDATLTSTDWTSNTALSGTFGKVDASDTSTAAVTGGGIGGTDYIQSTNQAATDQSGVKYTFDANADLSGFSGFSVWIKSSSASDTMDINITDTGAPVNTTCGAMTAATWQFCDYSFDGIASTSLDVVSDITIDITDGSAVSAATYSVDRLAFYYDKVVVDVASNGALDTNTTNTADNLVAYLKDGGTEIVSTGYFYSSTQAADASSGSIHFYPTAGDNIVISDGSTETYALELDTGSLLDETSSADETLTFSIDYGSATGRAVTAGDFWWYDTNNQVKWVGDTSSNSLQSNTLTY